MINSIQNHPCIKYADELSNICRPLKQIDLTYFGYAYINNEQQLSVFSNHPDFLAHYLKKHYYNADIHLAKFAENKNYIILDAIQLTKQSKMINDDAIQHGIKHLFSIADVDSRGTHFYHFANNSPSYSINQFYINNLDLLKLFIKYFYDCINSSIHLKKSYDHQFAICDNALGFSIEEDASTNVDRKRNHFIKILQSQHGSSHTNLSSQQEKCIKLLIKGLSAKQISQHLNISTRTVENYLAIIRQRQGFRNSREIIAYYQSYFK